MLVELLNIFGLTAPATTVVEFVVIVLAAGFIGTHVSKFFGNK